MSNTKLVADIIFLTDVLIENKQFFRLVFSTNNGLKFIAS